ncbi:MAG: diphosphomevalonate decarboxylase [Candidatus Aenigmarchaeota archaeon]|nr:diphosphomevalonate decarboxylase [Candidatus Aenigmarchaeota archaeon]
MKASASANSNIALVKYWGKRDAKLFLPHNGSISITLDGLNTHTTCAFSDKLAGDKVDIDGKAVQGAELKQASAFLDIIRGMAKTKARARVVSKNNFPAAAGLASSASGFAALALAAGKAAGLNLDQKQLSLLARRGSGSACRSIYGGFVEWQKGSKSDGSDSHAIQLAKPTHWPEIRVIAAITSRQAKKIKSRAGMAQTVSTSPFYPAWKATVEQDLDGMRQAVMAKNFRMLGQIAEHNCLKMFGTMITTKPAILYWSPKSVEILHAVMGWREEGLECYFTCDAGPQVKVLCLARDEKETSQRLLALQDIEIIVSRPGGDAHTVSRHLF